MQAEKAIEIEDEQDKNHRLVISSWQWHLSTFHVLLVRSKSLGVAHIQGESTRALNTGGRDHREP